MLPVNLQNQQEIYIAYQQALIHNPYYLNARINYSLKLFQHQQFEQGKHILKQGLGRFYTDKYQTVIQFFNLLVKYSDNKTETQSYQLELDRIKSLMINTQRIGGSFLLK